MPLRLTQVDALLRRDHSYLERDDECFFIREYEAGGGYAASATNNLINNLKKSPEKYEDIPSVWRHKLAAIKQVAHELAECISPHLGDFSGWCFVPMPPSKAPEHPDHDDRLVRILRQLRPLIGEVAVCELLRQPTSHAAGWTDDRVRPGPDEIYARLRVANDAAIGPAGIVIFDDVLTTGAHYKGAERRIRETFPDIDVKGLFIARRLPKPNCD